MAKLWDKGYTLNQIVEDYMTGNDPQLDLRIGVYDCEASIAHAKMLRTINIINEEQCQQLNETLNEIIELIKAKKFIINPQDEDVHTAIENYLVNALGDTGKKIHTGRSRNDQVLTALRLYSKDQLKTILVKLQECLEVFFTFAEQYQNIPYVGRTHYQKAMPSSMGLWMGAFLETFLDDGTLILDTLNLIDQCPLGAAASYGVALPIDRQYTSDLLGFAKVQNNVLYANNSRGKFESIIIHALSQIMLDMSKLATDVILFSAPEMTYFDLPLEFCPGSSLMPNKKNPDPFELIRAKSASVSANLLQTLEISRALPSGYNRDFQETKRPLFESFDIVKQTLEVTAIIIAKIQVNEDNCLAGFSTDVFATDQVMRLVNRGMAFRDAYKQVALNIESLVSENPHKNILAKTHLGGPGNLGLMKIRQKIDALKAMNIQMKEKANAKKINPRL